MRHDGGCMAIPARRGAEGVMVLARRVAEHAILVGVLLLAGVSASASYRLAIQPLGTVDEALIRSVATSLQETYDVTVEALPAAPLPSAAYTRLRDRYRAEKLLDALDRTVPDRFDKVIGLTVQDISTTKGEFADWGIFGLAYLSRRPCVVSTFRLQRKASRDLLLMRLLNVVRHEVGHTFGLGHCPTAGCVMEDARVDRRRRYRGRNLLRIVQDAGFVLPARQPSANHASVIWRGP